MAKAPSPSASISATQARAQSALPLENQPASYEAAQTELEALVAKLESGDLALDQLLVAYQRGAELLKFCRDKLTAVEDQIKVLDAGVLKPWTPE